MVRDYFLIVFSSLQETQRNIYARRVHVWLQGQGVYAPPGSVWRAIFSCKFSNEESIIAEKAIKQFNNTRDLRKHCDSLYGYLLTHRRDNEDANKLFEVLNKAKTRYNSGDDFINMIRNTKPFLCEEAYRNWCSSKVWPYTARFPELKDTIRQECQRLRQYHRKKRIGTKLKTRKWTAHAIKQFVLIKNIKTRMELCEAAEGAYNRALKLRLLTELFGERKDRNKREYRFIELVNKAISRNTSNQDCLKGGEKRYLRRNRIQDHFVLATFVLCNKLPQDELPWRLKNIDWYRQFVALCQFKNKDDVLAKSSVFYAFLSSRLATLDSGQRLLFIDAVFQ